MTFENLNLRHRAALFLALLAAGASLVWGTGARQAAGIALLGIAFAWAFGSNSRLVHWVFVGMGSALILAPICYDWYDHRGAVEAYKTTVAAFERKIPELAKQYPYEKTDTDAQTGARMGWNGAMWVVLSSGTSTHKVGDEWNGKYWISEPSTPAWAREALQTGVNIDAVPDDVWLDVPIDGQRYLKKPTYSSPEPFSVINAFLSHWIIGLPGLAVFCVGLILVFGVRTRERLKESP